MLKEPKYKTTVLSEFLKSEYDSNTVFQRSFKDYDEFVSKMSDAVITCYHCGIYNWKSCDPRCDCIYENALKARTKH